MMSSNADRRIELEENPQSHSKHSKRKHKRKRITLILSCIVMLCVAFCLVNNYCISTTHGVYNTSKVQDEIKIVLISDLHGKIFGSKNAYLCSKIKAQNPDIVIMAGDIMADSEDTSMATMLVEGLVKNGITEIYYSIGNHEKRFESYLDKYYSDMEKAGAKVLSNSSCTYTKGDTEIEIFGLDLPMYFYSGYDENGKLIYELDNEKLNEFLGESSEKLNLLIAHNPIYFEAYANWGADIVFSGHNHGGVIRLPWVGGLFSPNGDKKNRKYDCGEYSINGSTMFLSRGLGEWAGPVRAFNLPEVYSIVVSE